MAAMAVMPSISATAQPSAYREALPENSGTNMNLIRPEALRGSKMFVDANRIMPGVTAATPRISTGNLPTLEGHVLYSDANAEGQTMHPDAMYSFNADGTGFTKLSGDSKIYGSFGAVWLDGIYYQSSLMEYSGGTWVYSMANYDISTWKMIKYNTSVRPPSVASALVEVDELVYGCFFRDLYTTGGTMVFGRMTMDMNRNYPVEVLSTLPEIMVSMATDARGEIYGFGRSGDVYRIDKTTGKAVRMGASGVKPQYVSSAAFDNLTGKIYWNVSTADGGGYIYSVEPATGKATLVSQLPGNEEIVGLRALFRAAPKAPAAPQNVSLAFANGSLTGKVNFTIPTTSYDNASATGSVKWIIRANGVQVAEGTSAFGAQVSADVNVPQGANYNVAVVLQNEAGYGPKTLVKGFIGNDTPSTPEVTASWSGGKFTVKWKAVKTTDNGGYMDPSQITYSVLRMPDSTMVATMLRDTVYTDAVSEPNDYTIYTYRVFAQCNGKTSAPGISNQVGLGAMHTPWKETFATAESLDRFTIIDVKGDKNTWGYNAANKNVRCASSFVNPKDDWLITPSVHLEAGKSYKIGIEAYSSKGYDETFDIRLGKAPAIEAMTTVVVPETTIKLGAEDAREFFDYVTVAETGNYYIGVHACSPKSKFNLYVNNIFADAPLEGKAPGKIENLSVTPSADGAHTTEIKGVAPKTDLLGGKLSKLNSIVVKRGETVVKTLTGITPGQEFSYTDRVDTAGEYSYTVYAVNDSGEGRPETLSVYVGVNIPAAVSGVTISETSTPGTVEITWNAPAKDIAGKPLPAGKVTYRLVNIGSSSTEEIVSGLTSTTYTWRVNSGNIQDLAGATVYAVTESGASEGVNTQLIPVGKAYSIPYKESFNNGTITSLLGIQHVSGTVGNTGWGIYKNGQFLASDTDGTNGYAAGHGKYSGHATMLYTGMIDLTKAANPAFSFAVYNMCSGPDKPNNNQVEVMIRVVGEGQNWTSLGKKTIDEYCHGDTAVWGTVKTNLYAYKGKRVQMGIKAITGRYVYTFIDALSMTEDFTDNLIATAITAPDEVNGRSPFDISVSVRNQGANTASNFKLQLFKNGGTEAIASIEGGSLAPNKDSLYTFHEAFAINDPDSCSYRVKIDFVADQDKSDNELTASVKKLSVRKGKPHSLTVTEDNEHHAILRWTSPDKGQLSETVLEDFENFPAFATSGVGDWTFVDGDKKAFGGPYGIQLPGIPAKSPLSFFVFDRSSFANDGYKALSGKKYLASLGRADYGKVDDWAISPLLSGNKQTVSFFAKSFSSSYKESIEMLYSTSDTDTASFIKVQSVDKVPGTWTNYTCEIPAGAKYFAIRSVSLDNVMLQIDDVQFEQKYEKPVGFNIYRDGVKINDAPVSGTTFTDKSVASGSHEYCVTAVYAKEESEASNFASVRLGADVVSGGISVYTEPGRVLISGALGRYVMVAEAGGRVLYCGKAQDTLQVAVSPGVHIVKVGTRVYKVMVR